MTWKQLEILKETRLWITHIGVPVAIVASAIMANPDARAKVTEKANKIKAKFTKKEEH